MMKPNIIWILLLVMNSACRSVSDERLDYALTFAGDNRGELEAVLEYYRNDEPKYRAARFLIEHMPAYYSYRSARLDSLKRLKSTILEKTFEWRDSVSKAWENFYYENTERVYDCKVITSDFLIDHIDHTFEIWENRPWSRYYSFDDFCRWVLPYRIADEPLESWRKVYYRRYGPVLDSLYTGTDVVEATDALGSTIKDKYFKYNVDFRLPHLGASFLLNYHLGACRESCDYTVYVLRSLGIPVDIDHYLVSPEGRGGHSWNVLKDTTGLPVPFWFMETRVSREWDDKRRKAKIYRSPYGMPVVDVTAEYFGENRAEIPLYCDKEETDIRLGIFTRSGYVPVDRARVKNNKAIFCNIEPGVRFVPVFRKRGGWEAAGYPFCITSEGAVHSFVPDSGYYERAALLRKYPLYWGLPKYFNRMAKARVMGGTQKGDCPVFLGNFPDTITTNSYTLSVSDFPVRYVSIVPRAGEYVEIGEIAFYDKGGHRVGVRNIEAFSSSFGSNDTNAMIDEDILSFYSSVKDSSVIFDLGKPVSLGCMYFVPRNDDNFIRPGDEYELFYQNGIKGWISLGRKRADKKELVYDNIPGNALLWLRDWTRGQEEQVFILKDGKQYFYR